VRVQRLADPNQRRLVNPPGAKAWRECFYETELSIRSDSAEEAQYGMVSKSHNLIGGWRSESPSGPLTAWVLGVVIDDARLGAGAGCPGPPRILTRRRSRPAPRASRGSIGLERCLVGVRAEAPRTVHSHPHLRPRGRGPGEGAKVK
jgi:hypothetical protein